MTGSLVRKLLRDVRLGLIVVALLLAAFQCLWAKITERITVEMVKSFAELGLSVDVLTGILFKGPGKIIQTLLGGESIKINRIPDMLSVGYVHPLVQTILCVWAVGRAAGAVAGEIDRGTMELLLAQPLPRYRLILAHLCVDLLTIPVLCLSMWGGTWLGAWLIGLIGNPSPELRVDPWVFGPGLLSVAALLFAVSGYTVWLSARGRFRWRVLGVAVLVTLVQFLVNVVAQLWDAVAALRPFTVFYYYQPQQVILDPGWASRPETWHRLGVLLAVGAAGYAAALWAFCRRDLPAPL
jgi:ABC-2 type transport system permease protein